MTENNKPKPAVVYNLTNEGAPMVLSSVGVDCRIDHVEATEITVIGQNVEIRDPYHSMQELYEHRCRLFITLCKALAFIMSETGGWDNTWDLYITQKTDEWFVLGIVDTNYNAKNLKGWESKQLSYHLPIKHLEECLEFAGEKPDLEFDGHTSADVLMRLSDLI